MSNQEKSLLEKVREVGFKHALLNAVKYNGRADLKAVTSKIIGELPEVRSVLREYIDVIKNIVEEVNKLPLEKQLEIVRSNWPELLEEKKEVREKELPPLPNAVEGAVVTRFAPNPDYTIHLGNARPALLSYWYASMYKGRMVLRFEDTDPRTKSPYPEAYQMIKQDLEWLGVKWSEEYVQSLRIPLFYEVAKKLIEKGGAYVDKCGEKEFKAWRKEGRACPHRELPPEAQLEEFDKMLSGHYGEGEAVVRVKTDLKHPDPSVRDWVAFRIIDTSKTPHPVVGERYIVWPTYNFAAGVDDYLMSVTHILRAKEHVSNTVKQKYLYDHMGWKYPETIHFGRLSLEGVILSKSKMRKMIKESGVEAYSDPRLGTLSGLRRRGITRECLWRIIKDVGIKPVDAKISYANLSAINRVIVDPVANRYMAVEDPVQVILENVPEDVEASIPVHPSRKTYYTYRLGWETVVYVSSKDLPLSGGGLFRIMGVGNFQVTGASLRDGKPVVIARLHSREQEEARKHGLQIIQWVKEDEKIPLELLIPEGMRLVRKTLLAEKRILGEKEGSIIQLYRIGFARIEKVSEESVVAIYAHD
ncbi:glutamate--tRNA ligase [Thermosphaera sp.]